MARHSSRMLMTIDGTRENGPCTRRRSGLCATATAELKRLKFGGSLEELLAWCRENKIAEHRALEQSAFGAPEAARPP